MCDCHFNQRINMGFKSWDNCSEMNYSEFFTVKSFDASGTS